MYKGYIVRLKNLRKHSNADRLQIGECFGNNVVLSLEYKENELGIYFPTDGKLGKEYAEINGLVRKKDEEGNNIGGYLDPDKRNIRSIRLRGEESDGLFMPISSLESFGNIDKLKEGDTLTELGGTLICEKYVPIVKKTLNNDQESPSIYPYFKEHSSTPHLSYNMGKFKENDLCYITVKMHGTSGRTSNTLKKTKETPRGLKGMIHKLMGKPNEVTREWEYATGTRRTVLRVDPDVETFRTKAHNKFKDKLMKGETVYYEIVGYEDSGKPIMPSCDNKKLGDKEFIKEYGKTTEFSYGCESGESEVYVYRMNLTTEEGNVIEYPWELVKTRCEQMNMKYTKQLDKFLYTNEEDLMNRVDRYANGADPIGKTHIREGIVVRIEKETFVALKHKNFDFKVLEGIIKDTGILDMEEAEGI